MIIEALLGAISYRIRGGMFNETVRVALGKPEGWEIPNTIIRAQWCLYITLMLPISWLSPLIFGLTYLGVFPGYFKQVAEYFNFPSGFDLTLKENRTWKNYALLSARGAYLILPLALCLFPLYPGLVGGVLAGALMPALYLIGVMIPEKKGIISHSQIGELMIGLTIGATLGAL